MRTNGSVRGAANQPTTSAARGLWTLNDVYDARRRSLWPAAGGDAYFANVSALLHFDNNITDVIGSTWTNNGSGCTPSSAQSKFGGYSLLVPSSSGYLSLASAAAFQLGNVDMTIEAWVYVAAYSGVHTIVSKWGSEWVFYLSGTSLAISTGGGTTSASLSNTTPGRWTHVAACRSDGGNEMKTFQDGALLSTQADYGWTDGSTAVWIGQNGSTNFFDGYIDDLRITKGVARYTAAFTAPTAPFPDA